MDKYTQLEKELSPYLKILAQAIDTILDQDVSSYPIFITHQHQVDMGLPLVDREKNGGNWSINVSTLEEFVTKQLIVNEKIEEFRSAYKDPRHSVCFFVLSELGATFVFLPRVYDVKINDISPN